MLSFHISSEVDVRIRLTTKLEDKSLFFTIKCKHGIYVVVKTNKKTPPANWQMIIDIRGKP